MITLDPRRYGAKADGNSNDTQAIQSAIDEANAQGGGIVDLNGGTFSSGTLFLKSNVILQIGPGTVLEAIPDASLFPDIEPAIRSRMDTTPWKAFLYAYDQENITVRGEGLLHGQGDKPAFQTKKGNDPNRPYGLHFVGCRNVEVRGIRMKNSAFWMQRYLQCDGVHLQDVKVFNHSNLNNDGVDIDSCRNVIVANCRIDSSDDALCFKSEGAPPCEHVTVTNCVLNSYASALKFGTASIGGFRNFAVSNLTIHCPSVPNDSHGVDAEEGMMGIDIGCVDGGVVENINIANVVMEGVETPIFIKLGDRQSRSDRGGPWDDAPPPRPGVVRDVRISNISARGVGPIASAIVGYEGNTISGIVLNGISISPKRPPKRAHDWDVELHAKLYPMNRIFNSDLPGYGFYLAHAKGIIMSDVSLTPPEGDERPAIAFESCENIRLRNIDAASQQDQPIQSRNSRGLALDGRELSA